MHLLDRQTGAVHLPEAKEVLSHMTKPISKTRSTKMIPKVSAPVTAMHRRNGWESTGKDGNGIVELDRKSLQGRLGPTKEWKGMSETAGKAQG